MDTTININLAVNEEYDVIVLGGGPAGVTAAAASAREGAKTLLAEATGCLGGMATSGLVTAFAPYSNGGTPIYAGLAATILEQSRKTVQHVKPTDMRWVPIDPEALKVILDDLVTESGADILFLTTFCAVQMKDKTTVGGVVLANKSGLTLYRAKQFVDATGDADLAAKAGAPFEKGDDNGDLQPASLCFTLANVDTYSYLNSKPLHPMYEDSIIYDIVASGKYPHIPDTHLCNQLNGPGIVGCNAGHMWGIDGTDAQSLSRAMIEGRKIARDLTCALREYDPRTFANANLIATAALPGIRESRRIVGDYRLTREDYAERRSFADEIGRSCYYLDLHISKNEADNGHSAFHSKFTGKYGRYQEGESHGIPYRCLLPQGLDNVLVAGKTVSAERIMQAAIRVMPSCFVMGEAAGIAAAMAVQNAQTTRGIHVSILREKIKANGGYIQ